MLPSEIRAATRLPFREAFAIFQNAISAGDYELVTDPAFDQWCEEHQKELEEIGANFL